MYSVTHRKSNYVSPSFNAAIARGDPHMVTLDGLHYTFNDRGEFILIETVGGSFKMQGRMIEALDTHGNPAGGTVFSAIAAKQNDSDTIQIEVRSTAIRARLNGEIVDFTDLPKQDFNNVTLCDKGNSTISAHFSSGIKITATVELRFISVIHISLPSHLKGTASGLLGNFNGDLSDDLLPRGGMTPLPPESSQQDIHEMFAKTCKCIRYIPVDSTCIAYEVHGVLYTK